MCNKYNLGKEGYPKDHQIMRAPPLYIKSRTLFVNKNDTSSFTWVNFIEQSYKDYRKKIVQITLWGNRMKVNFTQLNNLFTSGGSMQNRNVIRKQNN